MKGNRVMQTRGNSVLLQIFSQTIPIISPDHVKMVDTRGSIHLTWRLDTFDPFKQLIIKAGIFLPLLGPFFQKFQLGGKHCPLDRFHAVVVTYNTVVVSFGLPVLPDHPGFGVKLFVVSDQRPCLAVSTKILARVKTESAKNPKVAHVFPVPLRQMGLTAVFHH